MTSPVSAPTDFLDVTELSGEPITSEQYDRLVHRYGWAARYCVGRDAVELACGSGAGLGLLAAVARSFEAGDFSEAMVARVRRHYGDRIAVRRFDAQAMPFADHSKDVILIFEAIYYLPDIARFIRECRRVLRPGGQVVVVTCNKDLYDFNPSPHSHSYPGVRELAAEFGVMGFRVECFGYFPVAQVSGWQRLLRPVKRAAVAAGLMPKTMRGKLLLKRLVFGPPVLMPAELTASVVQPAEPVPLDATVSDRAHKVIYCLATMPATVPVARGQGC
jgi:SAM-dependent methyltransferase